MEISTAALIILYAVVIAPIGVVAAAQLLHQLIDSPELDDPISLASVGHMWSWLTFPILVILLVCTVIIQLIDHLTRWMER